VGSNDAGRRRVVVTGIGLVTPLGCGTEENWTALVEGRSGIRTIETFDCHDLPVRVAGEIRNFDAGRWIDTRERRRTDPFVHYAIAAAEMAAEDARLPRPLPDPDRVGVIVGAGIGGIRTFEESAANMAARNWRRISPFFVPRVAPNMASGHVSIRLGARGAGYATASACASGAHAIADACSFIREGRHEVVVAGGSEAAVCFVGIAGFAAMRALASQWNDEPTRASRPFDARRDGFVLGEGAGMVVLEAAEHAERRGAPVLAELLGFGVTSDAYHVTQPAPEGAGAARCIADALRDAGLEPADVDYVNAHGTGTPYNDAAETRAIRTVFGPHADRLAISSTKSMTGHLLGAAGAVEAAYAVLTLARGVLPPTLNLDEPDPECDLDYVPHCARTAAPTVALSNAFGFGGTNACLVFRRCSDDGADGPP
jgi:3-oxoacyl-[acyl-carrier-protein] synthase II